MTRSISYEYEFNEERRKGTVEVTDPTEENTAKPLILLLHGMGGDSRDMVEPHLSPDNNYDYTKPFPPDQDKGWRAYPGIGIWSFKLDDKKDVVGWRPFLERHGYRTATYSQADPTGFLAEPVIELAAVMTALMAANSRERVVVLAHSRGGLLLRKFIKDNRSLASSITLVITLHSPHRGSNLANLADLFRAKIEALQSIFGSVVTVAFGWLLDVVKQDAYLELATGSSFLMDLENGEVPLPGVDYYTFGGTSVELTRLLSWVYTPDSVIPQWHLPPFHHRITQVEMVGVSPILNSLPDFTDEIADGKGDMLVADRNAHLPSSFRRTNSLNHAEALWDPKLQAQVLGILEGDTSFWS